MNIYVSILLFVIGAATLILGYALEDKILKILDELIAIFKNTVYNISNKSADCGKNIRWRLLWRLKETFI